MDILIAGTSFKRDYGGPAISVSQLAAALACSGARVGLWAPDGSARTSDVVPCAGSGLFCLGGPLDEALAEFGPLDVIHDNGLWLPHNHRIATLARRRGIPRVVSVRGMLEPWAIRHKRLKKAVAWRLYQRRDLTNAALLHATAESEASAVRSFALGVPIATIANGTPLPDVRPEAEPRPKLLGPRLALFLSRLHPKKGLPTLIEAWARLRPHNWRLEIAGPDEAGHRAEVEALVARHGLAEVVAFLGPVEGEGKADAYRSADLFVLPTHSENFGMVVAEALSYGVPVLTTHGAPWRELEMEGCGWWVAPTVEGILAGLSAATAATSEVLIEMGRRGRALIAARYGWEPIAQRFLTTYAQMISGADLSERNPG